MRKKRVLARPIAIIVAVLMAFTFMPMLPGGAGDENEVYAAGPHPAEGSLSFVLEGSSLGDVQSVPDLRVDINSHTTTDGWTWDSDTHTLLINYRFNQFAPHTDQSIVSIDFNVTNGATVKIKLLDDIEIYSETTLGSVIKSNTDLEIDLNGHSLCVNSMNYKTPLSVTNTSNLSIIDSEGSGSGRLDLISDFTLSPGLDVSGKVTIDVGGSEVNIESNYTLHAVMASGGFVLDSGNVGVTTDGPGLASTGDVIINGGKLYIDAGYIAISTNSAKSLIVNGGYLNANSGSGNVINTGSVAINGGHVAAFQHIATIPDDDAAHKTLSGGILETRSGQNNVFTFTGGIYSKVDGDDEHEITVKGSNAVWPENFNLPNSADMVTIEAGATLTIPEGVTLDLAGTIYNFGTVINNGNIHIKGDLYSGGKIQNFNGNSPDVSGMFINNGTIEIYSGYTPPASIDNGSGEHQNGVFQNYGDITNGGKIINEYGSVENFYGGTITNNPGAEINNQNGEIINSGDLINETGAEIDNRNGEIINSGMLVNNGSGTIDNSGGGAIYDSGFIGGSGAGSITTIDTNLTSVAIIANIPAYTYTGKAFTPVVTLTAPAGITTADYTVKYSNNVNAGTASVTITGKGKYGGSKTVTFKINPANLAAASVTEIADQVYTGKVKKPAFTVKHGGATLAANTHYTVTHSTLKAVGKATITITGKGNYTGTKTVTFKIVPAKTSIKKATVGKKTLKVTWKKISGATKYQVQYRVKGTSAWKTKTASAKSTSFTIKSLKKGKAYQVRIRAYQTIKSGTHKGTYNAPYSAVKTSKKVK